MPRPRSTALILEDEPRYRDFLAEVVRGLDFEPVAVGTAAEARRAVEARPPELLLLDLNLPVVDGMQFFETFRETHPTTPTIIITAFGELEAAKRAIRLGVSDFLSKPCDLGELEAAIDRARRRASPPVSPEPASTGGEVREDGPVPCLAAVERDAILDALRRCGGNRSDAARKLGISRRALYNKIDEYRQDGQIVP